MWAGSLCVALAGDWVQRVNLQLGIGGREGGSAESSPAVMRAIYSHATAGLLLGVLSAVTARRNRPRAATDRRNGGPSSR